MRLLSQFVEEMDLTDLYRTYERVRKSSAAPGQMLYLHGEISGHDVFIDGTKIESCANKYTLVWKKSVTKSLSKVLDKAVSFVQSCEEKYGIKIVYNGKVSVHTLKRLRKEFYRIKK